jgi:DNA-binding protein Fis
MKKNYHIEVDGCDDSTCFEVELDAVEFELVKMICEKCTATSAYGCQPRMTISELDDKRSVANTPNQGTEAGK